MNDKDEARQRLVKRLRQSANFLAGIREQLLAVTNRHAVEAVIIDLRQAANEIEDLAGLPSTRTYTATEVACYFMSGEYDHLTAKEFREKFPMSRAELHRLFRANHG